MDSSVREVVSSLVTLAVSGVDALDNLDVSSVIVFIVVVIGGTKIDNNP